MEYLMKSGGSAFMPIDEESAEYKEAERISVEAFKEAEPVIGYILKAVDKWVEDGMPKKDYNNNPKYKNL